MSNVPHGWIFIVTITVWLLCPSVGYGRQLETKEFETQDEDDDDDDDDSDGNHNLRMGLGITGAVLLIAICIGICWACSRFGCLPNNWRWTMRHRGNGWNWLWGNGTMGGTIETDTNLQARCSQNSDESTSATNVVPSAPNPAHDEATAPAFLDDVPDFTEITSHRGSSSPVDEEAPPPSYYDVVTTFSFSSSTQPVNTTLTSTGDSAKPS